MQQRSVHLGLNGGSVCTGYVLMSQQVILVWCSRALYIGVIQQGRASLGDPSVLGMSSFPNRFYWFGVVGLCTLGLHQQGTASSFLNRLYWFGVIGLCTFGLAQQGVYLHWVWPHFSIGYTGLVQQDPVHLGSISRGGPLWGSICTGYDLISQQVILIWCSRALYTWTRLAGQGLFVGDPSSFFKLTSSFTLVSQMSFV